MSEPVQDSGTEILKLSYWKVKIEGICVAVKYIKNSKPSKWRDFIKRKNNSLFASLRQKMLVLKCDELDGCQMMVFFTMKNYTQCQTEYS